jgi:succinate dehydrogenase/fumarate reductase cytochrome b subunit (b558 family)
LSQAQSRTQLLAQQRRAFLLRKLHSLTGIVPVGVFLCFHLWTNAKALQGQQAFDEAVADISHLPYLVIIEVLGIGVPLLVHALLGLIYIWGSRVNVHRYPTSRNWMYVLQRLTGLLALGFIAYHVYQLRFQLALGTMNKADFFPELCASLSATVGPGIPLMAIIYLLGVAASVLHLANGLYGFCFSWGITVSRRAARLASGLFGLFGLALFALGANTVIYFATGTRLDLFSHPSASDAAAVGCQDLTGPAAQAAALGHLTAKRPGDGR